MLNFKNRLTILTLGFKLCVWIIPFIWFQSLTLVRSEDFELHPQDGYFNNLIHPDWGAIDGQLLRKAKVAYSDGVYMPAGQDRPNPFDISVAGHHGPPGLGSIRNRSAFMVFFGQQVVEEILDAQRPGCPREFFNIKVQPDIKTPDYDPHGQGDIEMPLFRARYDQRTGYSPNNPRQQLNEITPYIDGTLMYGVGKAWTDALRELNEEYPGRLKALDPAVPISESFPAENDIKLPMANPPPPREHDLKPVARFWRLGNPRGNENPFLLAFGVLWFRYHNYLADQIHSQHPELNDEQVFNRARKQVIAVHQKIVMYDWLPRWLSIDKDGNRFEMPPYDHPSQNNPYKGYEPNIHPGISQEFQTAAFRFGHTLVTPGTWIRDKKCNFKVLPIKAPGNGGNAHALRLCNAYWNPQEFLDSSPDAMDNMLMGLATTRAEREDHIVVPDLREHLFGPLEFSRRDLVAINIQRARDHGLPDYNSVREAYGLARKASWEDINTYQINRTEFPHPKDEYLYNYTNGEYMREPIMRVKNLYGNTSAPDNLDLFSGGILETTPDGPGELFRTIILDQFLRIRHGDRFWFENRANGLFDNATFDAIWNTTILDVVMAVTNITSQDISQDPFMINSTSDTCFQPEQLKADSEDKLDNITILEQCTPLQHYDYFSGSEISFALSFLGLGLLIPVTIGVMILMAHCKQKKMREAKRRQVPRTDRTDPNTHLAVEWVGDKDGERNIKIKFDKKRKKLHLTDNRKKDLRMIDLRSVDKIDFRLSTDKGCTLVSVRVPGEIDLVLRFTTQVERIEFLSALEKFLLEVQVSSDKIYENEGVILKGATTKEQRKKKLDDFFRVICSRVLQNDDEESAPKLDDELDVDIEDIQLTRTEFADALGLKYKSLFLRNMFLMVDKDKKGLVGFKEFMDMFTIIANGDAEEKARLLFNMHDLRRRGHLTPDSFKKMLKSMLDLADSGLDEGDINNLMTILYRQAGLRATDNMKFQEFKTIFASRGYEDVLEQATLQLPGRAPRRNLKESFLTRSKTWMNSFGPQYGETGEPALQRRKSRVEFETEQKPEPKTGLQRHLHSFNRYVENYKRQIFWVTLYILITIGIFVERAYYYSIEREHVGLRRVAGYGVSVTRGAASGMMWTYSCLLITMSRNTITFLRETFLHRFIPFDSFHTMHKLVAIMALFFTVMHCIGHGINFYHISTWASVDLNCVFREYYRTTDVLTSFHYWAWTTITGVTGIVLTVIVIIMYVFALPYARQHLFGAFWITHSMYILVYIFMILHGSGRLVQAPLTQNFLIGPLVVYMIDKLISFSRKKVEISVTKAELLPSDVLALTLKRPLNFEYKSGQWVRIACLELGKGEYHPFTLTSSPHEDHLSLHIRAVGPWTMNMRKTYDKNNRDGKPYPKLYLDGPFGEGHQDWYRYKVAVLIGGGIGVTPFASILKDIAEKSKIEARNVRCEKVYFLWVTRTQKQFEWFTDIIKKVEEVDDKRLVNVHIFITQFQQKFDLRTTMLYVCERKFQIVSGKSLFTGLRATTHFGRPQFEAFFKSLGREHPGVREVGVFSCGPPPMTLNVDRACADINASQDAITYAHHFENF